MGNAYQNGAGERCDSVKNIDLDSGDILNNVFQSDINDFNLDFLKSMSQSKTFASTEGLSSYGAAGTLTSCQTNLSSSEPNTTHTGPVFPFRGCYSSSNEDYQTQPVFPESTKILKGINFKAETAASKTDLVTEMLGNSFEPGNLH